MALSPYPKYIDSNLSWLHAYPESWNLKRGKNLLKIIDIRSDSGKEELLTVSSKFGVIPRKTATVTMFKADSYVGYKLCWEDDLVINSLWAWAGGLGVSKDHGIISSAYGVYRIKDSNQLIPEYLNALVRSTPFQWELQVRSKGIWTSRLQLTDESFLDAPILIPPIEEQRLIARYLTHINNKIQKYISAKRKLIKLLEEQKQAIIHQAVTGAFNVKINKPYEDYNATNIPWIAKIPKHWNSRRLRTVSTMLVSNVDKHTLENEQPVRLCNYVDVYKNERIVEDLDFMKASATQDEISNFKLKINDVLVTKDSEIWTDIGVPSLVCHEANDLLCGYHLAIIRPKNEIHGEYLLRLLQDKFIATQMHVSANGVTRYGLSHGDIKNVTIPIPSIDEQIAIADFLNEYIKKTSLTIRKYSKEIELIQEYRTSIIANVVTGKVDVRKIASTLPNELEVVDDIENSEEEIIEDAPEIDEIESN